MHLFLAERFTLSLGFVAELRISATTRATYRSPIILNGVGVYFLGIVGIEPTNRIKPMLFMFLQFCRDTHNAFPLGYIPR